MRLMSRFNWFVIPCSIATTTALINPSFYDAIAILFLGLFSLVLLSSLGKQDFNWHIGGIRKTIALVSLILMCIIIPQVETDLSKFSVGAIVQTKSQ